MSTGRISVAPCGHTGETIVGSYVRCLVGCEGTPVASKRGEPGHVLNCTCAPCQIRRRTSKIVLRTRDGKDFAVIDWDGVQDVIVHTPTKSGELTNYKFLDADNKIVAQGALKNLFIEAGYELKIKTKLMMDASSQLEVSQAFNKPGGIMTMTFMGGVSPWGAPMFIPPVAPQPVRYTRFPTTPAAPTAPPATPTQKPATAHINPTTASIKAGLECIMDLLECDVSVIPGQVIATIKKYSDYVYNSSNWKADAKLVIDDANAYLKNTLPAGVGYRVEDRTPINLLDWAVEDFILQYKVNKMPLAQARDYVADFIAKKGLDTYIAVASALTCVSAPNKITFTLRWHGRNFNRVMTP